MRKFFVASAGLLSFALSTFAEPPPARGSFLPTLNPLGNQAFGSAVAVSDHYAIAGVATLPNGGGNGVVYVFDLYASNPATPAFVLRDPDSANSFFGYAVAISGNFLAVGAPGRADGGATPTDQRSVLIYDLASANPEVPVRRLSVFDTYDTSFGRRIAMSGSRVALKSYKSGQDKILIFDLTASDPTVPAFIIPPPNPMITSFGVYDLWNDLVAVGTSGAVYTYDLSSANPTQPFRRLAAPRSHFGANLKLSERFLAVTCFSSSFDEHDVFVYSTAARFSNEPLILPATTVYGVSVGISGSRVLIGSAGDAPLFEYPGHRATDKVLVFSIDESMTSYQLDELAYSNAPNDAGSFGLSLAATSRRILVAAPTADGAAVNSGQAFLYGDELTSSVPKLEVRDANGAQLANGQSLTDIGGVAIGTEESRDLLITNAGDEVLSLESISVKGNNAADFSADLQGNAIIAPGASAHLIVTFHPSFSGEAEASVSLECNDPANNPFILPFAGLGATDQEYWRLTYFGVADNAGDAADDADPDGDGNSNLLEYVAGLNPTDPHSAFTVTTGLSGDPSKRPVITFGPIVSARVYELQGTTNLGNPDWQTLSNVDISDNGGRRSIIDNETAPRKFYRVTIRRENAKAARALGSRAAFVGTELNSLRQR